MSRVDNVGGSGFTVDNGAGLVVRTKLNQVIAALSTLSQGSGTPTSGLAAYTPFIDGNTLKIQNSSNDGQVTLGDVSATNFGHAGLSAANTFTSTNIFQEDVTFDGATAGRDIVFDRSDNALEFADNAKAIFGTSGDLEIYHDGLHSIVRESGTGNLLLGGTRVNLQNSAGSEFLISAQENGPVELYHDNNKKFETASGGVSLTGGAAANIQGVNSSSNTTTLDFATACHFVVGDTSADPVVLKENTTIAAPSNQAVGQAGSIFIKQDGTGSRTVSFATAFKFAGGSPPTLSTAAGAVDRIDYIVFASGDIHAVASLDVKRT